MALSLDDQIKAVVAAEATYNADAASVVNIQTAVATASAPLVAAEATVAGDVSAFNDALDALVVAAQAAKIVVAVVPVTA